VRARTARRAVRTTDADLAALVAKGFTVTDSWSPRNLAVHSQKLATQKARHKSGMRADLGLYLRSAWESNVARWLTWQVAKNVILKWEYEPDEYTFPVKRGSGKFYTPDFKIWTQPDHWHYLEVKGYMSAVSLTKLKRMQKYFPQFRVDLMREEEYRAVEAQFGALLPHWEWDTPPPKPTIGTYRIAL